MSSPPQDRPGVRLAGVGELSAGDDELGLLAELFAEQRLDDGVWCFYCDRTAAPRPDGSPFCHGPQPEFTDDT